MRFWEFSSSGRSEIHRSPRRAVILASRVMSFITRHGEHLSSPRELLLAARHSEHFPSPRELLLAARHSELTHSPSEHYQPLEVVRVVRSVTYGWLGDASWVLFRPRGDAESPVQSPSKYGLWGYGSIAWIKYTIHWSIMLKFMLPWIVIDILMSFCSCDVNYAADVIKLNYYDVCIWYICNDKLLFSSKFLDACW